MKSRKPTKGHNKLGNQLFMESGLMKVSIITIQLINRLRIGLNKLDLKFSKKGMGRFGTTISWYERV